MISSNEIYFDLFSINDFSQLPNSYSNSIISPHFALS